MSNWLVALIVLAIVYSPTLVGFAWNISGFNMNKFFFMVVADTEVIYGVLKAKDGAEARLKIIEELKKGGIFFVKEIHVHGVTSSSWQFERLDRDRL